MFSCSKPPGAHLLRSPDVGRPRLSTLWRAVAVDWLAAGCPDGLLRVAVDTTAPGRLGFAWTCRPVSAFDETVVDVAVGASIVPLAEGAAVSRSAVWFESVVTCSEVLGCTAVSTTCTR